MLVLPYLIIGGVHVFSHAVVRHIYCNLWELRQKVRKQNTYYDCIGRPYPIRHPTVLSTVGTDGYSRFFSEIKPTAIYHQRRAVGVQARKLPQDGKKCTLSCPLMFSSRQATSDKHLNSTSLQLPGRIMKPQLWPK